MDASLLLSQYVCQMKKFPAIFAQPQLLSSTGYITSTRSRQSLSTGLTLIYNFLFHRIQLLKQSNNKGTLWGSILTMPLVYSSDEEDPFQPIPFANTVRSKRKAAVTKNDDFRQRKRKSSVVVNVREIGSKVSPIIIEGTPEPDQAMSQLSPRSSPPPLTESQQPWNGAKISMPTFMELYEFKGRIGRGGYAEVFKVWSLSCVC
jgi:hypothetical protein